MGERHPSELQINGQGFWLVLISFIIYSYNFNIIMKYIFQQVRSIYVLFCLFLYVLLNIFLHNMKKILWQAWPPTFNPEKRTSTYGRYVTSQTKNVLLPTEVTFVGCSLQSITAVCSQLFDCYLNITSNTVTVWCDGTTVIVMWHVTCETVMAVNVICEWAESGRGMYSL